ncbi:MAG TPA: helix-turn-helix domain-containing protein [Verrucomicrobiae bacterium]|nr:helix-turn-helix domain-containing protein [Verrucomicrobiae bacterium]
MTAEAYTEGKAGTEGPTANWEALANVAGYRPRELARAANVSLRTLQRHFADRYDTTVRDWLRSVRLKEAYQRISAGDSVKEVAYDLGYKQISHFSRDFKNEFGVPPSLLNGGTSRLHSFFEMKPKAALRFNRIRIEP